MKKCIFAERPFLCLFAAKNIKAGDELTYDYGDISVPWRKAHAQQTDSCSENCEHASQEIATVSSITDDVQPAEINPPCKGNTEIHVHVEQLPENSDQNVTPNCIELLENDQIDETATSSSPNFQPTVNVENSSVLCADTNKVQSNECMDILESICQGRIYTDYSSSEKEMKCFPSAQNISGGPSTVDEAAEDEMHEADSAVGTFYVSCSAQQNYSCSESCEQACQENATVSLTTNDVQPQNNDKIVTPNCIELLENDQLDETATSSSPNFQLTVNVENSLVLCADTNKVQSIECMDISAVCQGRNVDDSSPEKEMKCFPSAQNISGGPSTVDEAAEDEMHEADPDFDSDFVPETDSNDSDDSGDYSDELEVSQAGCDRHNDSYSSDCRVGKDRSKKKHLPGDDECSASGIHIQHYSKKETTSGAFIRSYNKVNACLYCEKMITVIIGRHYQRQHPKETAVAKIIVLKPGSRERKKEFDLLRHKGNFYHNEKVRQTGN